MSQVYKTCPICGATAHHNAVICPTCGTTLTDVNVVTNEPQAKKGSSSAARYDYRYGETDLYEGSLRRRGEMFIFGGMMALAAVICIGAVVLLALRFLGADILPTTAQTTDTPTPVATIGGVSVDFVTRTALPIQTNTARPLPSLITVTPAPPTAPPTSTPAPCIRQVAAGDSLLGLALSCGHRDLDVIDLIVATNQLSAPEAIQVGQELIIPWPTPTLDPSQPTPPPDSGNTSTDGGGGGASDTGASAGDTAAIAFATETLQPGVAWHTVIKDETMLSIAVQYGANAEILSQLNPEVEFSQCDFGMDSGGPRCIVTLIEGQQIRVPAPTPTPTIPPTPSGSETPTPTATPTFNAPASLSPGDRALFQQDELVTLRWVTTGTLGPNEVYRIQARDTTLGVDHTDDTHELFYVVPVEWQGTDGRRHEFAWSVSVINLDAPDTPIFTTETRTFIWESRAGTA
ncbi:MAG: LysM peptidoglycan-binding domain-containing protein [Anaerolineae bacterium]|nr:LysM peptidoglycan-binding domain-containing protein [Anaerolineae bacterium]